MYIGVYIIQKNHRLHFSPENRLIRERESDESIIKAGLYIRIYT